MTDGTAEGRPEWEMFCAMTGTQRRSVNSSQVRVHTQKVRAEFSDEGQW